ncbi:MAG: PDZ domain-containing protein [Anaerolineae bacterium]|nr:PDZ domain-containing protein [Anaerolineae bacterium]
MMNRKTLILTSLLLLSLLALAWFGLPAIGLAPASPITASALNAGTVFDALEATLGEIYEEVSPSVVNIQVVQDAGALSSAIPQVPGMPFDPSAPQQGTGSGFVWDREGHIVTNNHVVQGATEITVVFPDDTTVPAEVVGTDPHSDLAVIKVDLPSEKLIPVQVADSTQVRVGQLAVAIGNPFGLEGTMTVGFVSALGRSLPVTAGGSPGSNLLAPSYTIPDIIQTDAPINPGNSGGVLVDDEGRVIGVPTAIESPVRANAGIGFAVPSVIVQKVVPALIAEGGYEHPWLGISGTTLNSKLAEAMDLDADQRGVLVIGVEPESPSDEAGLRGSDGQIEIGGVEVRIGGDVIVAINDQPVEAFDDLVTYLVRRTNVGETASLTILRDGREETVQVMLAARPVEQEPSSQAAQGPATGAWLGVRGLTLTPEIAGAMDLPSSRQGVLVAEVINNTAADRAGLRGGDQVVEIDGQQVQIGGDIIVAVDGEAIARFEELKAFLVRAEPRSEVTFTLLRDGDEVTVDVTLGEPPASMP